MHNLDELTLQLKAPRISCGSDNARGVGGGTLRGSRQQTRCQPRGGWIMTNKVAPEWGVAPVRRPDAGVLDDAPRRRRRSRAVKGFSARCAFRGGLGWLAGILREMLSDHALSRLTMALPGWRRARVLG
jgi:hypothetical protein